MIACKICAKLCPDLTFLCPECKNEIILDEKERRELWQKLRDARRNREYELAYPLCKRLADAEYVPAIREWGAILESGELGQVRLDEAMRYFKIGATLADGYSAYRYSRLVGRVSTIDSDFWLLFAAAVGTSEAAPATARLLDDEGNTQAASYYFALSAKCDNVDSIVTMAKRYLEGIGVPKNPGAARWYMDKLTLPPIYALSLAYKLRGEVAKEPPPIKNPTRELVKRLIGTAAARGLFKTERHLCELLADSGDVYEAERLAIMCAEGIGGEVNPGRALHLLESAITHGSASASKTLGDYYLSDKLGTPSTSAAIECYQRAAELGEVDAYVRLGDLYLLGEHTRRDVERAAKYYFCGAKAGNGAAKKKYDAIVKRREELFSRACVGRKENKLADAFALFSLSASFGHAPAKLALARCYIVGDGVDINRRQAFEILSRAADDGVTEAYFPLGICYGLGVGTRLDYKKALSLFSMSRASGDERASVEAEKIRRRVNAHLARRSYSRAIRLLYQRKYELAKSELEYAASEGHGKATYALGAFYEFGFAASCDKARAYELYSRANSQGYADTRNEFKLTLLKMTK